MNRLCARRRVGGEGEKVWLDENVRIEIAIHRERENQSVQHNKTGRHNIPKLLEQILGQEREDCVLRIGNPVSRKASICQRVIGEDVPWFVGCG